MSVTCADILKIAMQPQYIRSAKFFFKLKKLLRLDKLKNL